MKHYYTVIFILLSLMILIIGIQSDIRWSRIITWGLIFISLIFAAYFTKYIPNKKKKNDDHM